MEKMESDAVPQSTSLATKSGVKKLTNWLIKRKIEVNFHSITEEDLSKVLRRFYAECKRDNGKPLTPSSLVGIRAAISRYLIAAPFYRSINLVSGKNFTIANKMFDTKCKLYYKSNNPKPKHKAVIEEEDMKKLGQYFKDYHQSPILLSETIWFLLCFHFGRRGREGWAEMKKDFFTVNECREGTFVECSKTEQLKNIQGGHKQADQDYSENRMGGEAAEIFKFFISKLNPECDRFFQYPKNSFQITSDVWYANKPVGKNTLSQMMPRISEKAGLSTRYTCHCVRASCITALYQAGVSVDKITAITRHKNASSLKHYVSGMSTKQKDECSSILSASVFGHPTEQDITIVPRVDGNSSQQVLLNENSTTYSKNNVEAVAIAPRVDGSITSQQVATTSTVVPTNQQSGMIAKYSELFGSCTFNNCDIKFS